MSQSVEVDLVIASFELLAEAIADLNAALRKQSRLETRDGQSHTVDYVCSDADGTQVGIRIDPRTAEVWVAGRPLQLTAKEYQALLVLHRADGGLVTKQALATGAWPELGGIVSDDSIEQLIARLRRKIEETPDRPRCLLTVRGLGYRLVK